MPDSADATGNSKANAQKGRAERKEPAGTEAINEVSRHYRKEPVDEQGEGKGSRGLGTSPAVFLQDGNVEHPDGITYTQGEKEGEERDDYNHPAVIESGCFCRHPGDPFSKELRLIPFSPCRGAGQGWKLYIHQSHCGVNGIRTG